MSKPDFSLDRKVALVTGGKRGIGKAIALAFAEAGADVAVCGRNIDGDLSSVANAIEKLGRRSLAIQADVSKKVDVDNMMNEIIAKFGTIDILVNNAGLSSRSTLLDITEEEWDEVMNVDLKAYFICAQTAGRVMVSHKTGNIVNISSILGLKAQPNAGGYSIAKAGVIMLTKALAQELGKNGVRSNCIAPGVVKTELSKFAWTDPVVLKTRESLIPIGRIAKPEEIANVALFLASDAAAYVNGAIISVDGGQLA